MPGNSMLGSTYLSPLKTRVISHNVKTIISKLNITWLVGGGQRLSNENGKTEAFALLRRTNIKRYCRSGESPSHSAAEHAVAQNNEGWRRHPE